MKFVNSPYYNKDFLGKVLYENIHNNDYIFTVYEYFGLHNNSKEYHIKDEGQDYCLKICKDYYELDCQKHDVNLYLVFDKPVHITGEFCEKIIAPEIVIETNQNSILSRCVAEKVIISKHSKKQTYRMRLSKIYIIYFYDLMVTLWYSEIDNFFIFNKDLCFNDDSWFLNYYKIKCFGSCEDLKKKILKDESFQKGIIHIE